MNTEKCGVSENGVQKTGRARRERGGKREGRGERGSQGLGWRPAEMGWGFRAVRWHFVGTDEGRQKSSHMTQTITRNLCVSLFMFIPMTTFPICLFYLLSPGSEQRKTRDTPLNPGQDTLDPNQNMILKEMEKFSSILHGPMKLGQ